MEQLENWLLRIQNLSERSEREWRKYFMRNKVWVEDLDSLGYFLTSSHESVVYKGYSEKEIYKAKKNRTEGDFARVIKDAILHNKLFPDTSYSLVGFTDYAEGVRVILKQNYIEGQHPGNDQIIEYLNNNGYEVEREGNMITARKGGLMDCDIYSKNAIITDGKIFIVDCNIKCTEI